MGSPDHHGAGQGGVFRGTPPLGGSTRARCLGDGLGSVARSSGVDGAAQQVCQCRSQGQPLRCGGGLARAARHLHRTDGRVHLHARPCGLATFTRGHEKRGLRA